MTMRLCLSGVGKTFVMHLQDGIEIPVLRGVELAVKEGECVALTGPSGTGKSTILRMIYGNYVADEGQILVVDGARIFDMASAPPRRVIDLRLRTISYVSQFLRAVPRVPAIDVVAEPLRSLGTSPAEARDRAATLLARLNLPERLWSLPPATFSGGEQQRVNIARGLVAQRPILILDEPTASLDATNRDIVVELIDERKKAGTAVLGIFHDAIVRDAVADHCVDVQAFT
ncbi:phosphonate C-P lyase system protein PhnL [Microbaculum marinisediminis]|uniref:Phosphonate C-P lyase system protein PhnL n=1 Tax=Microbaculum marinisediminis TaxID=2931392 RepID=A0AAW5R3G0_9HYPH|nr:phosphonate C-P lyase system protein PhnL [Microbaculum sp. A6E488]MCT8974811.1 phosphonate C-P lyase system protein PhnL [Microbaculum sp. A6E488]